MVTRDLTIPIALLYDKRLDATNKIILAQILSLITAPEGCCISDESLGSITSLDRCTVNKRISFLANEGFIETKQVTKNGKIIGRRIMIVDNPPPAVEVEKGSVPRRNTTMKKFGKNEIITGIIAKSRIEGEGSVSSQNIISSTSSISSTSNLEFNTNTTLNDVPRRNTNNTGSGKSQYEDAVFRINAHLNDLIQKSSLGEKVLLYTTPEGMVNLEMEVPREEFNELKPIVLEVIKLDRLLFG